MRDRLTYEIEARDLPQRRGPAEEAKLSYDESDESVRRRETLKAELRADRRQMPRTDGKPDKHTRRKLRERNRKQ